MKITATVLGMFLLLSGCVKKVTIQTGTTEPYSIEHTDGMITCLSAKCEDDYVHKGFLCIQGADGNGAHWLCTSRYATTN